jgi:hypothetical protein
MPLRIAYQQQTTPGMVGAPRAQAPGGVDAFGAVLQDFAKGLGDVAKGMAQASREADLVDRVGKATSDLATLELAFERDQDFRTAPQRFAEQADAIRDKYLDGVNDPAVATAFKKQYGQMQLAKSINVQKSSFAKEKDYNVASLDANLDTYATNAANAKNPAEAALVEQQARLSVATMQAGGWISAEEAGKRERTFLAKRDHAVVLRDMSIDSMMAATKLTIDPTYAANVDPVQRERLADQSFRRADSEERSRNAEAERQRKARGDELVKDGYGKQASGTLTRQHVDTIKAFIEPAEYKSLLSSLNGAERKDDPVAYSELQGLVYSNPAEAERRAFVLHQNGRIRNETLSSILSRSREISRSEGPRTPYERERLFITNAIKPSDLVPDPSASARYALVIREFDDYALKNPNANPEEIRAQADGLLKKYTMVDMVDLARKTAAGAQPTPQQQLDTIGAETMKLIQDRDAKRISPQEFNRKMEPLNRARKAAEKALNVNGGK